MTAVRVCRYFNILIVTGFLATYGAQTSAYAQSCVAAITTNQICTNGSSLTGGANGISDLGGVVVTNLAAGTIFGSQYGILSSSASVNNFGIIYGTAFQGVLVQTDGSIINSGTISGGLNGIYSYQDITALNSGYIEGLTSWGIRAVKNLTLDNELGASIVGSSISGYSDGVGAEAVNISNAGSITGPRFAVGVGDAPATSIVSNSGTMIGGERGIQFSSGSSAMTNTGSILGGEIGIATKDGTLTINNSGSIIGTIKIGVYSEKIGGNVAVTNSGSIQGGTHGVYVTHGSLSVLNEVGGNIWGNVGIFNGGIATIENYGTISSGIGFPSIENNGTIMSMTNSQGGTSGAGLTYSGALPGSYYIYIASSTKFGQITFTSTSGSMTVGVELAPNVRPASRYDAVINGVTSGNLTNTAGSVNGWNWRLEQVGLAWNLLFLGPNAYDTYADLARSANNIRNTIALRSSSMALMMDYNCRAFAQYNTCISFGGRYGDLNASTNEGAGVLTAAYRVSPSMRIGAFIDHRVTQSKPAGIRYSDDTPSVGSFIGYDDHSDGTGVQGKLTAVYNTGKVGVTRLASSANTEAGSGSSRLSSYAVGAELGWGIQLNDGWVGTPYAGIKHTSSKLGAYAEQLTDSVKFPISYAGYGQRLTTATVGGRIDGRMTERVSIALAAGIERDLHSTMDAYAGTSDIPGLTSFSFSTSANSNRSRAVGSAALSYKIASNQRVSAGMSVRENAYVSQPTKSMQIKYEMAF